MRMTFVLPAILVAIGYSAAAAAEPAPPDISAGLATYFAT